MERGAVSYCYPVEEIGWIVGVDGQAWYMQPNEEMLQVSANNGRLLSILPNPNPSR